MIIQGGIWMAAIGLLLLGQIVAPLVVVPLALLLGALSLRLSANRPLPPVPPAAPFNWRDKTTLVIVTTCGDTHDLGTTIDQLLQHDERLHVLVCNTAPPHNRSSTERLVASDSSGRLHILNGETAKRRRSPVLASLHWATAAGYEQVVQMEADGRDDPAMVPVLLNNLASADLVTVSRRLESEESSVLFWHDNTLRGLMGSRCANWWANTNLKLWAFDSTATFRAWRAPLLRTVTAGGGELGMLPHVELLLRASRNHATIAELPVAFRSPRAEGCNMRTPSVMRVVVSVAALQRRYATARV